MMRIFGGETRQREWLAALIALLFAALTIAVALHTAIASWDTSAEDALYALRNPLLVTVFLQITVLANATVVALVTAILAIALALNRRTARYALALIVTVVGAALTDFMIKLLIERARPSVAHAVIETSFSYPSGHATAALALYGFIAYIFWCLLPKRSSKITAILTAVILIGGIGFSRLYLGVHFPSDVLAGYLLGGLWLLIGVTIARRR